ncbi:LuxR C-terminal-related transcriptional regulator [Brevibacillus ruminantium]|uniref:LuxR C-terminal-related transcriptional regulator n=1 Tax=Brevibacillus ruminantium TaxID=2950604 RepID=A0ABY4WMI1_9BACL|nr:LuxR C-terminal-related transcriptional regulator [Brevibacillus ruminantium]USG66589.1 LuxR C-terminal-related transcriptional regulator [Brevibacillus ruminantium]
MGVRNILIVDDREGKQPFYSNLLSVNRYDCHFLNNDYLLSDPVFLKKFDFVILHLTKDNIAFHLKQNHSPTILLMDHRNKHYLKYIQDARAILLKDCQSELMIAINVVERGGCYYSSEFMEAIFSNWRKEGIDGDIDWEFHLPGTLTEMELRVAEELANDRTNQQIADALYLSKRTVEYHIAACMQKLGVKSRVGLAVKIAKINLFRQMVKKQIR